MTTKVAVVRCRDYEYINVDKAIRRCIELLDKDIIPGNKKVLLKPNLLSSRKGPDVPANTHSVIVEALAGILKDEYNCSVFIGDSSGGMSYGQTQRAFEVSGLNDISKRLGVKLVNFETTGILNLRNEKNKIKKQFPVTKFFKEIDYIISVPKLKTHSLVGYTGAVKNMMGMVPGSGKRDMHLAGPKPWQMEQCIVDLYALVKPHLAVMDAVISMEGDGPAAGEPRCTGLILASSDAVALDTVALEITGFDSGEMFFIKEAARRGLGAGDINAIDVVGEELEDIIIKDFKKPVSGLKDAILNILPGQLLKRIYAGMTSGAPFINDLLCKRCNVCYDSCPVKTIEKSGDGRLLINQKNCIECYCCHELCPYDAIGIKMPLSVRMMRFGIDLAKKILHRCKNSVAKKLNDFH